MQRAAWGRHIAEGPSGDEPSLLLSMQKQFGNLALWCCHLLKSMDLQSYRVNFLWCKLVRLHWPSCKYGSSHWHKPCCNFKKPFCSWDKCAWEAEHPQLRGSMTAKYITALVKRTKPYTAGRRILLFRQSGNFTVWFHSDGDGNQHFCRFSI